MSIQEQIELEYENKRAEIKQAEQHKVEIENAANVNIDELHEIKMLLFRLHKEKLSIVEKSIKNKQL